MKGLLFDACISSSTLEHLPTHVLNNTFKILKKIIKKNGIISAVIDYSDHYSHTDDTIGHLNFLQFSDSEWRKYNTFSDFSKKCITILKWVFSKMIFK